MHNTIAAVPLYAQHNIKDDNEPRNYRKTIGVGTKL